MAQKIKKDDLVKVLKGKDKNKTGKVISVNEKDQTVVVDGINIAKLHKKKTEKSDGGIISLPRPIHKANISMLCPEKKVPTKVGYKLVGKTKKRFSKKTGSTF